MKQVSTTKRVTPQAGGGGRARWVAVLALAALLGLVPARLGPAGDTAPQQAASLAASLEAHLAGEELRLGAARVATAPLRALYTARGFTPLWVDGAEGQRRARRLLVRLRAAAEDGLAPADYAVAEIAERLEAQSDDPAALDLLLSDGFLRYARDLGGGRPLPAGLVLEMPRQDALQEPGELVSRALAAPDFAGFLAGLAPDSPRYRGLRGALPRYRAIATAGGWPRVPEGPTLREGDEDPRVALLRARLSLEGDLSGDLSDAAQEAETFDPALSQAVRRFQERHGLEADGLIGRKTRAALDVPAETRLEQIMVNMERWRRMPWEPGGRFLLVNIAGFSLEVIEDRRVLFDMRAIVGRPTRPTPVFSNVVSYMDFNPTWTVPRRIAKLDILPELSKDLGYLAHHNMRVFIGRGRSASEIDPELVDWLSVTPDKLPVTLRQDPGPENALGRVKFMLPNQYDVYLHDTPQRNLFGRDRRAFSSGCVRLERPLELAEYLLAGQDGWSRAKIEEVIQKGATVSVWLARPIPIHMAYVTAWASDDGRAHFRDDVYGLDAALADALHAASPGGAKLAQLR
jgi:murein L,D-transpeptidase YcbB/YkuD